MSLPKYQQYKESQVDWLGKIPSHWAALQSRRIFEQRRDSALGTDEQLSATQKYGVVPQKMFMELEDQKVMLALSGLDNFKHVEPNDFVISLRSFQGGIEHSSYAGCVSPAYTVLRAINGLIPKYWAYLLKCDPYIRALQTMTDGIRDGKNISYSQFGTLVVPIPSLEEQAAIATFLDRETAKIDALIAEQEKLLVLLAEKRQATISHAVTRGLNPDVPLKDSGVEWLGMVPAHWGVGAIGYLSNISTGATPDRSNSSFWNGEVPWLKTGEINWKPISEAEEFITDTAVHQTAVKLSPPGTMLMAMYGQGVTRGRVALLEIEAAYNQACAAISFERRVLPQYAVFFFMAAYDYIRDSGNETSQMNLNAEVVGKFKMTIPSIEEQREIAVHLDSEIHKFDKLQAEVQSGIALLKERRSTLISAAVTGKIDVREHPSALMAAA